MGRAAKMASGQYQGQGQPGHNTSGDAKSGPKQTPRKDYQGPSSAVAPRGVGMARNKPCKMY